MYENELDDLVYLRQTVQGNWAVLTHRWSPEVGVRSDYCCYWEWGAY